MFCVNLAGELVFIFSASQLYIPKNGNILHVLEKGNDVICLGRSVLFLPAFGFVSSALEPLTNQKPVCRFQRRNRSVSLSCFPSSEGDQHNATTLLLHSSVTLTCSVSVTYLNPHNPTQNYFIKLIYFQLKLYCIFILQLLIREKYFISRVGGTPYISGSHTYNTQLFLYL